jgi:HSP20 family protein
LADGINNLITLKASEMTQIKQSDYSTPCTYPGAFIPAPLVLEEIMAELKCPHEGETRPLVNIVEMPDVFTIELAAPGLKRGDFYVTVTCDILRVGVLHKDTEEKLYRQHEFNYCCFHREIPLPVNVDTNFLNAVYEDGILYVKLPKTNEPVMNRVERVIIY